MFDSCIISCLLLCALDEASSDSQNEALLKKKLCDVIKIVKDILAHHKSMKATPVWAAIHNLGVLFAGMDLYVRMYIVYEGRIGEGHRVVATPLQFTY